jgi:poly(A) polymerase/tRNA nucleotidyltransferase (CCA-adding enzyme)
VSGVSAARQIAPPPFMYDPALLAVLAALPDARLVGGAVRDAIAGRPVADVDLAVPRPPEAVIAVLDKAGLKHAPTGLQHGTVTAISGGRGFEITTLRTDQRTDGRHAEVVWTEDWQQDAARRDFTINAMSMTPGGAVYDYFGGLDDLAAGRVRFVGEARQRIAEDYLRVLRFFRFQARYGAAEPDLATAEALRDAVPKLSLLSAERVWSELKRILAVPDCLAAVGLMHALGVLEAVLLHGVDMTALERLVESGAPPDPLLRLVALYPGAVAMAERLRLSKAEASTLEGLAGPAPDPAWGDHALRRALVDTAPEVLIGRAWLAGGEAWQGLRARIGAMQRPVFPLSGRDAVALGVPPGPAVGGLLAAVRGWWLAGGCVAGVDACRAELARLAAR